MTGYPSTTALELLSGCLLIAIVLGGSRFSTTLLIIPLVLYHEFGDTGLQDGMLIMAVVGIIARIWDTFINQIPDEALRDAMKDEPR